MGIRNELAMVYARLLWRVGDGDRSIEIGPSHARFSASNFSEYHRILYHNGEREIISDVIRSHSPDEHFMDVGANIGIYSCLIGSTLTDGEVIAYEPHPKNFEKLLANMRTNGTPGVAHRYALYNKRGNLTFDMKSNVSGEGHGQVGVSSGSTTVETIPGDESLDEEGASIPATIKIDVEGAEGNVLDGLSKTLRTPECKRIYCEVHPAHVTTYGYDPSGIADFLLDAGFSIEDRFGFKDSYCLKAVK